MEEALPPLADIVDKIYRLESSGGKNNFSKCEAIGKNNRFGYGIYGEKYICFDGDDDRKAVEKWFKDKLKYHTLEESVCGFNLGFNSINFQDCLSLSDEYNYLKKYYSL